VTDTGGHVHYNFGGECQPGDIASYVLLPTAAHQVEKCVSSWQKARKVAHHYEFLVYTGEHEGVPLSACSTGIGGMSVATAIEELARLGARTFVQLGLAELLEDERPPGELMIAKGAARFDGTSHDYVRPEFPALAHFEVVMAAIAAAEHLKQPYRVGVVASMASAPLPGSGPFRSFLGQRTKPLRDALRQAGVAGGSGEEATVLVQCALYGFRAGAISARPDGEDALISVGLETMRVLAEWDRLKEKRNLAYIVPPVGV
jgi:uridine phosphorylase